MAWQLEVVDGPDRGKTAVQSGGTLDIGRDSLQCNLVLTDSEVSRFHARLVENVSGSITLEDWGSTHGTFFNGSRIEGAVQLGFGDTFNIGSSTIRLVGARTAGSEQIKGAASISIGRDPSNRLVLDDREVSSHHAIIEHRSGSYFLTDLDSTNGTYLNGTKIKGTVELQPSSMIRIHDFQFFFDGLKLLDEQGVTIATFRPEDLEVALSPIQALAAPLSGWTALKWLPGSILMAIPVIEFFASGYRYRLLQNSMAGSQVMPDWKKPGELFVNGLLLTMIRLIYLFIPAAISIITVFSLSDNINLNVATIVSVLAVTFLFYLPFGFLLPMGLAHFIATGSFGNAFQIKQITGRIMAVIKQYLIALVLVVALWTTILILSLIPFAGIVFMAVGSFYTYCVSALLFGDLYRRSEPLLQP